MQLQFLTGIDYKKMILAGATLLEANKKEVDALNVFPVPDGDTGTNMSLTILASAKEGQVQASQDLGKIAQSIAMGSLMGARGNSGVILSQILRGIAKGFEGKTQASAKEIANALQEGAETAYKGVLKPVEGTILTVAKEVGKAAFEATYKSSDVLFVLEEALKGGEIALAKTPELLPVLKQVGVVDAGGKGYLLILEGALRSLRGEELLYNNLQLVENLEISDRSEFSGSTNLGEIEFHYCTEFLVKGIDLPLEKMREEIGDLGDSLMVVGTEEVAKVHVHSNNPGEVLEYCLKLGSLHEVKISNMVEQNEQLAQPSIDQKEKPFGVISVSVGEGLKEIIESLGVDGIIEGGQTLNPSTEDLVKVINKVNSQKVIILPNNSNIILAAQQAKELVEKEVVVIPSKSIPQGIVALITLDQREDFEAAVERMKNAIEEVSTGEITYAVRDSQYEGNNINKGDMLGLANGKIKVVGQDQDKVFFGLLGQMLDDEKELVTIYYGQETTKDEAEMLVGKLAQEYPEIEFELHFGGQPLYYYIFSIE